jgi:SAM-dependent methyltransferase
MSGPGSRRDADGGFDARAYWETRLSRNPGREGVGHAGLGEGLNAWMYRLRRRAFLRELAPLIDRLPSRRVLDVGSGTGFFIERWRELGAGPIVATDISDAAVARLAAAYPGVATARWTLGEVPPGELLGARFGAISAIDVLYHVLEDDAYARAFASLYELLEPGGTLVLTENFLHGGELRVPHQRSRTLERVEAVARSTGFEIVRRRPLFWLMNAPHDSTSRLHQLWWRGVAGVSTRSDAVGWALGAALYWPEVAATERLREGPSTELALWRRPR